MKRLVLIFIMISLLLSISACAKSSDKSSETSSIQETSTEKSNDNTSSSEEMPEKENINSNNDQANSAEEVQEDTKGCFEDIVTDINDSFGEKTGEKHTIVATADAYNKDHKYYGEVKVYYLERMYSANSCVVGKFVFYIPAQTNSGGAVIVRSVSYKLDDQVYDNKETDPQVLYDALIDGKEVTISLDNGEYIFTISGKGLSELINNLPN